MNNWVNSVSETVTSYRRMIDAIVAQLTDEELNRRPAPGVNSVAVLLRHLGGNLQSRWTDFLTTDGEKPTRDRESEFRDWDGTRETLLNYFDTGWSSLTEALAQLDETNISKNVVIRGEAHSLPEAILRSVTHVTYHIGQMAMVARLVHEGDWVWLTIAPGTSDRHNQDTWGSPASRSIFSGTKEPK